MMNRILQFALFVCFLLSFVLLANAQTEIPGFEYSSFSKTLREQVAPADSLFIRGKFKKAASKYKAINARQISLDEELLFREAASYVELEKLNKAYRKYLKASAISDDEQLVEKRAHLIRDNNLMRAARIEKVLIFKDLLPLNTAQRLLNNEGKYYGAKPWFKKHTRQKVRESAGNILQDVDIHLLDTVNINTKVADFASSIYPSHPVDTDTLYYVSERSAKVDAVNREKRSTLELFRTVVHKDSLKGSKPQKIYFKPDIKNDDLVYNEAGPLVFFEAGRQMIFTRNVYLRKDSLEKKEKENKDYFRGPINRAEEGSVLNRQLNRLALYTASRLNDTVWSEPQPIVFEYQQGFYNFNLTDTMQFSIGHPALDNNGARLYFSSNAPPIQSDPLTAGIANFSEGTASLNSGTGILDPEPEVINDYAGGTYIYFSNRKGDKWGQPRIVKNVVLEKSNNIYPFVHSREDGEKMLYFASNRTIEGNYGGLDIFMAPLSNDGHSIVDSVKNAGSPVNSSSDDFAFLVNESGNSGYLSSDRDSAAVGDDNLYKWFYPMIEQEIIVTTKNCSCGKDFDQFRLDDADIRISEVGSEEMIVPKNNKFMAKLGTTYTVEAGKVGFFGNPVSKDITISRDSAMVEIFLKRPCLNVFSIQNPSVSDQLFVYFDEDVAPPGNENDTIQAGRLLELVHKNNDFYLVDINDSKRINAFHFENESNLPVPTEFNCACKRASDLRVNSMKEIALENALKEYGLNVNSAGCPIIGNLKYDFDRLDIREVSYSELNELVYLMLSNPSIRLNLQSHTDIRGSSQYNSVLSKGRAQSAEDYLILTLFLAKELNLTEDESIQQLTSMLYVKDQQINTSQLFEAYGINDSKLQELVKNIARYFEDYTRKMDSANKGRRNNQKKTIFELVLADIKPGFKADLKEVRSRISANGKGESEPICSDCNDVSPIRSDEQTECCHQNNRRTDYLISY